jgi:hypothetical protein
MAANRSGVNRTDDRPTLARVGDANAKAWERVYLVAAADRPSLTNEGGTDDRPILTSRGVKANERAWERVYLVAAADHDDIIDRPLETPAKHPADFGEHPATVFAAGAESLLTVAL